MSNRRGGVIFVKADGKQFDVKGQFEYNLGYPKREPIIGHDSTHGYKELPQEAYISGEITDSVDMNLKNDLLSLQGANITLELANGKVVVLEEAFYSGDGTVQSEEGNIMVRFTAGISPAKEIT